MSDRIMEWLDESQRLTDQATEGPWEADLASQEGAIPDVIPHDGVYGTMERQDAEFIAESRTRLPQAVAALREALDVLDRWTPPDPHEPDEGCPDCELLHHTRQAIADALGLEGDDDE